ncbi:MAG: glycosyltransferase [Alphaproteobacteria bacterium PRO2]|nr:glycosyltransferase [Alphaproteobacteria bacterium PRO2]
MKAVFVHDTYYSRDPESGEVFAFGAFPYELWAERFLPRFSQLTVLGRERPWKPSHASEAVRSDGLGVRHVLLPNINTPMKRIFGAGEARAKIVEEVGQADAVIVRGPSEFGMIAAQIVKLTMVNKTVAIEMSGCAFDHTWHHGSLTGKLYAPVKYLRARRMVNNADAVIYVTEKFLQRRYPARGTVANASNVEIESPSSHILEKRLQRIDGATPLTYGLIGNYGHALKGLDIALAALTRSIDHLPPFQFRVLGHGPAQNESLARFNAPLTDKNAVLEWLDNIDIYLQPSRHEGLPRALIEAMSRACPALGSTAGGIPELLSQDCLHRVGDSAALRDHIIRSADKNWQKQQAWRNFEAAKKYTRENLVPVRNKFWDDFVDLTRSKLAREPNHENIALKI